MALPVLVEDYIDAFVDARAQLVAVFNAYRSGSAADQQRVDHAELARRYTAVIGDVQRRVRRPSELVHSNEAPPLLAVYAPVLHELEQRLEAALTSWAAAHAHTTIIAAIQARIRDQDFTGLDAAREALAAVVAPMPRDIEQWGRAAAKAQLKGDTYAIAIDAVAIQTQLSAALLRDFARRTGVRPAAGVTLTDWTVAQIHAASDAAVEWEVARDDWQRVVGRLSDASLLETDLAARYSDNLDTAIRGIHASWERLVAAAASMKQLQADAAAMLATALAQIDDIAAAYVAELPVFVASDRVPGAPTTRDSATLFTTTPPGAAIVSLLQAVRPIVPASVVTGLRFAKTLPVAALASSATFTTLAAQRPSASAHMLDRLQTWASATGGVNDGGRQYNTIKATPG